jgi:hypothetical protein
MNDEAGGLTDFTAASLLQGVTPGTVAAALHNRGMLKSTRGDGDGALADFTEAVRMTGATVSVVAGSLWERASLKRRQGDADGEVADYTAIVQLSGAPVDLVAKALALRGSTKATSGDLGGDIADLTAAIALPGISTDVLAMTLLHRGLTKGLQGDREGEIADLDAVVNLLKVPSNILTQALTQRSRARCERGDSVGSIQDATAVIELAGAPTNQIAEALLNRGLARVRQGVGDASEDFSTLATLEGAPVALVARALLERGDERGKRGDLDGALADYDTLAHLDGAPNDLVYRARKRIEGAASTAVTEISASLEASLRKVFVEARRQRHEFITVEHLLLALLDNAFAAEVLRTCSADIEELRKTLATFIKANTPTVGGTEEVDTQPTLGFQRVIQHAIMLVQSTGSGKKEVTGANVLLALFSEKDSHAVHFLHQQGVTGVDATSILETGVVQDATASRAVISSTLEVSLHNAFVEARRQRHEFITVEHLLLALLDNASTAEVLRTCSADIEELRKTLATFIKANTSTVGGTEEVDTQPTLELQRVIQHAIMLVQSTGSGKKEVTGANVLVALFGEKDSHAVHFLHQLGVTWDKIEGHVANGTK